MSSSLLLYDSGTLASGNKYVGIKAPNSGITSYTMTLPTVAPTVDGQAITYTTAGIGSFSCLPGRSYYMAILSTDASLNPAYGTDWFQTTTTTGTVLVNRNFAATTADTITLTAGNTYEIGYSLQLTTPFGSSVADFHVMVYNQATR